LCAYLTLCCVCTSVVLLGHPHQLRQQDFVTNVVVVTMIRKTITLAGAAIEVVVVVGGGHTGIAEDIRDLRNDRGKGADELLWRDKWVGV
jgi:hypothetical protein